MGSDVEMTTNDVTEDDKQYAAQMWRALKAADDEATAVAAISVSLAAERVQMRARFLRLAQELDTDNNEPGFEASPDFWAGLSEAADRIRRVAGESR